MLTSLEDKEHVLRGMQAGVDDYLTKPLDRNDLSARLIAASRVTALHRQIVEQQRELESEVAMAAGIQMRPAAPAARPRSTAPTWPASACPRPTSAATTTT